MTPVSPPIRALVLAQMEAMRIQHQTLAQHLEGLVPKRCVTQYLQGGTINPDHLDLILSALHLRIEIQRRRGGGHVQWIKWEWLSGEELVGEDHCSNTVRHRDPPIRKLVTWRMRQQGLLPADLAKHLTGLVPQRSLYRYLRGGSIHPDHLDCVLTALRLRIVYAKKRGGGSEKLAQWGWGHGWNKRPG